MGHRDKRKYSDHDHAGSGRPGVPKGSDRSKRLRLSPEASTAKYPLEKERNNMDDDGWQVVKSKSSRRNDRNRESSTVHRTAVNEAPEDAQTPRLTFNSKSRSGMIQIKDLRDLGLYVLADGVAPNWVAVKKSRGIKKVVVVMLPGMDEDMLARAKQLEEGDASEQHSSIQSPSLETGKVHHENPQDARFDESSDAPGDGLRNNIIKGNYKWLFDDVMQVKAPGDPKYLRVHSPLQAMLTKSHEQPDKRDNSQMQSNVSKAVRTPITQFLHTTDELREAEYPIHPAAFVSQADAELERLRRSGAGQTDTDGWVDPDISMSTPVIPAESSATPRDHISQGLTIYAIDCEMVLTSDEKSSLARISVVSWPDSRVVLDKFVKPTLEITNYFTQYSGITPEILEGVTTTLAEVQADLKALFNASTILLGHSLESDLNALKMTHPFIIDTSMIYPHPRGLPLRSSLKYLANKYLKREIQTGGSTGHDSVEDARAVLDLVKLKCEKGPAWGTNEANGETVFKKLSCYKRNGRSLTSAIVEYGTPERGFGKDATVAIGCQDDADIVRGVCRVAIPNLDRKEDDATPTDGVDFTWARLRGLEYARGWVSNSATTSSSGATAALSSLSDPSSEPISSYDTPLLATLSHIQTLHDSLSSSPDPTLLILYSGTSDMRPVLHYQAMQTQYRKEFKIKKWDELSVKWTDAEEQALRMAVENARKGWGWCGILGGSSGK